MVLGDVVMRFLPQIEQAAKKAEFKYPSIADDALGYAAERVILFSENGKLAEWEQKVGGDEAKLAGYVFSQLEWDLRDFAYRRREKAKRERIALQDKAREPQASDEGSFEDYPTLRLKHTYGLTQEEIADRIGVSLSTVRRRVAQETRRWLAERQEAA